MEETNGRRETHDFMNVESFSQLPFIRRTPPKEKGSIIRLFGQELVGDNSSDTTAQQEEDTSETTATKVNDQSSENVKDNKEKDKDINNKRFECHYCFRNFPTSQALGGHQNAHKRERQHAKRGSMTSYFHHQQQHEPHHHVYGFHHHHRHYPSWTTEARFYGGGGVGVQQTPSYYSRSTPLPPPSSNTPTINGSPLGLWRVPPSTSANAIHNVYSASTASAFRRRDQESNEPYRLMKPNVQDHVSLDLHL